MEIIKLIPLNSIILILCISCSYTSRSDEKFDTAQKYITLFYETNDIVNLYNAKIILEQETKDIETFNALLNVYILLQEYHNAIALIENKSDSIFYKPYQKAMYYNYFQAKIAKTIEERNKYRSAIYDLMCVYIDQNPNDAQALFEYYFTIAILDSKKEAIKLIDKEIKLNKYNKQSLVAIKEAINNTSDIK